MAARFKTKKYTFLSSSPVTLFTLLGSTNDEFLSDITLRAGSGNVGNVTWQELGGTDGGFLEPREAASFSFAGKWVSGKQVTLTGTAGDVIYLTVVG